ncbi:hypothetical protein [Halorubrum sp. DTA98]|uniref:hypothetical protein n=1 Tax=Halorubrum sp. DTA98 TaxID=3402163 RepID=UPI003AABDC20
MSVVVSVKPSARKRNAKVGRLVFEDGSSHAFESRAAAERWADGLSAGDGHVWVASAHPDDDGDADLYLVSRATNAKLEAAYDKRRRRLRGGDDGEQRSLGDGRGVGGRP